MPSFPHSPSPVNVVRVVPDPRPHAHPADGDDPAGDEPIRADLDAEADEVEAALLDPDHDPESRRRAHPGYVACLRSHAQRWATALLARIEVLADDIQEFVDHHGFGCDCPFCDLVGDEDAGGDDWHLDLAAGGRALRSLAGLTRSNLIGRVIDDAEALERASSLGHRWAAGCECWGCRGNAKELALHAADVPAVITMAGKAVTP